MNVYRLFTAYATMTSVLYDLKSKIYEIVFKWKVKVRKVFFPFIVFALNFHSTINAYSIPFHWLHCYFDFNIIIIMFRFLQQKFNSLPHRKKVIHLGQFVRAGCKQQPEKSVLSSEPVCNPLFQGAHNGEVFGLLPVSSDPRNLPCWFLNWPHMDDKDAKQSAGNSETVGHN